MLKNFNSFDRRLLTVAIIFFAIFSYLSFDDSLIAGISGTHGEKIGKITSKQSDVRVKSSSDFRYVKAKKSNIYQGDSVFTGPQSKVIVTLDSGDTIEIQENSLITFSMVGNQLMLNLKAGQAKGSSNAVKIVDTSQPVQKTQEATKKITASRPKTPFQFKTRKVSSEQEAAQLVPQITSPKSPEIKKITKLYEGAPTQSPKIEISWDYPKSDVNYEIQVSRSPDFKPLEFSQQTPKKYLTTPDVTMGLHYVRVREQNKLWSKTATIEFKLNEPLVDGNLKKPIIEPNSQNYIISKNPLVINWTEIPEADQYLLEVAHDPDFQKTKKFLMEQNRFVVSNATPGLSYYRVTALSGDDSKSPTSDPARASVQVAPPVLEKIPDFKYLARDEDDHGPQPDMNLKWASTNFTKKYKVIVSQKPDMSQAATFEASQNSLQFKMSQPGSYFWQVQSLDEQGNPVSPPSQASSMNYEFTPPLDPPEPLLPRPQMTLFFQKGNENPFFFVWKEVANAKKYRLQVAKDESFKEIVYSPEVKITKVLMNTKLPQGQLYWRVQAIFEDRRSKWSEIQPVKIFGGKSARGEAP